VPAADDPIKKDTSHFLPPGWAPFPQNLTASFINCEVSDTIVLGLGETHVELSVHAPWNGSVEGAEDLEAFLASLAGAPPPPPLNCYTTRQQQISPLPPRPEVAPLNTQFPPGVWTGVLRGLDERESGCSGEDDEEDSLDGILAVELGKFATAATEVEASIYECLTPD
jgi:hypothetical protein